MKINLSDFAENENTKHVKSTERYDLYDVELDHLTVSITHMHPNQETKGHSHDDLEEVYIFLEGEGEIQIDTEKMPVKPNDIVTIKPGAFHKVYNPNDTRLKFLSIFEKYDREEPSVVDYQQSPS